jgi:hypothetical protein
MKELQNGREAVRSEFNAMTDQNLKVVDRHLMEGKLLCQALLENSKLHLDERGAKNIDDYRRLECCPSCNHEDVVPSQFCDGG